VSLRNKDPEAGSLVKAPCLIGLGAFFRLVDPRQKQGLVMLCGQGQEMPDFLSAP